MCEAMRHAISPHQTNIRPTSDQHQTHIRQAQQDSYHTVITYIPLKRIRSTHKRFKLKRNPTHQKKLFRVSVDISHDGMIIHISP